MRVSLDDLDDDPSDSGSFTHGGELFTGEVYETGPGGVVVEEFSVEEGVEHGLARSWYPDGTLEQETRYERGRPVGTSRSWHPNGRLAEERDFDDRGDNVARRLWSDDGTPVSTDRPL